MGGPPRVPHGTPQPRRSDPSPRPVSGNDGSDASQQNGRTGSTKTSAASGLGEAPGGRTDGRFCGRKWGREAGSAGQGRPGVRAGRPLPGVSGQRVLFRVSARFVRFSRRRPPVSGGDGQGSREALSVLLGRKLQTGRPTAFPGEAATASKCRFGDGASSAGDTVRGLRGRLERGP